MGLAAALVFGSCGGGVRTSVHPGDVEGRPSIVVLPDSSLPRAEWTRHMQSGWELAEGSFDIADPEPPADDSARGIQSWGESVLEPWLERKQRAVEAARAELDAAAEESHAQRIMAGALVGVLYEDVARVIRNVPVPGELLDEPEIATVYNEIVDFQASPFLEHARRAYRACALNAQGREAAGMEHWSDFCAGRRDRLPEGR